MTLWNEFAPGARAPVAGFYDLLNVMGRPAGMRITCTEGEVLPAAPIGWTWQFGGTSAAGLAEAGED
ncbi:MAG: hypothetical protein BGO51_06985 [Rhodospirillales bacterium 69-11]|nr:hypothetical protein [Rhodospirillales bacterium]MBN8925788.1 hypothetical protein [Rhodospirillales bacterium]OJW24072.1 MAG: hypothetical protein BGO51_06985 [Rhodospirillales bacterium 69-11]